MNHARRVFTSFLTAIVLAVSASAAPPPPIDCANRQPHVLKVGLPADVAPGLRDAARLTGEVRRVIATLPRRAEEGCPSPRPVRLSVAFGNDYELLDWFSQGSIDVAVLPDLAVTLLTGDGMAIREIILPERARRILLPESRVAAPRVYALSSGGMTMRPGSLDVYDAFLEEVWTVAQRVDSGRDRRFVPARLRHEVLFSSHLSSAGYIWPLNRAVENFNARLTATGRSEDSVLENALWDQFFASTRFAIHCQSAEDCIDPQEEEQTLISFVDPAEGAPSGSAVFTSYAVVTDAAAKRVFDTAAANFTEVKSRTPGAIVALVRRPDMPDAFRSMFVPEPQFGVRTYSFTVDESIRLVRHNQRNTSDESLSLVLPGGGVKAAYQTRIVDELYGKPYLRNEPRSSLSEAKPYVPVRTVIGTSGGALLGYFVAQTPEKPVALFDVLWKRDGRSLRSTDIFGWTDLLRYVSIVVSFAIFCGMLFFLSLRVPGQLGQSRYRGRLTLVLVPLFVLLPIVLRVVSLPNVEHVPEIEGIFYALMAILVMVFDQGLVKGAGPSDTQPERLELLEARLRRWNVLLITSGIALFLVPTLGPGTRDQVMFGVSFSVMVVAVVGGTLAAVWAHRGTIDQPVRRAIEIVLSIVAVIVLCRQGLVLRDMHIVAGFALLLVAASQIAYVRFRPRFDFQWLLTFAAIYLLAALCWPAGTSRLPLGELLTAPSLEISTGAFFLSLGSLLLLVGGAVWVYRSPDYALPPKAEDIAVAMVVLLAYVMATLLMMLAVTTFAADWVTPLELTARFWIALAAVSTVIGLVIVALSRTQTVAGRFCHRAITFLCGYHPNGIVMQRRYGRMLALAVFAVVWWNVVQAPGLYGNKPARKYHTDTIAEYNSTRCGGKPDCGRFHPTATFVTPANLLKQDGTRYFMFLADGQECPRIPDRPASGARWYVFASTAGAERPCYARPDDETIQRVAFASGSPFPIFPAHALQIPPAIPMTEEFVDGGYSNNVPIDAARTVGSKQVLIVSSSSPLPPPSVEEWWRAGFQFAVGKLVRNFERLPGYLFERSQQLDRLSARDMFVVSLSPSRHERNWPALFDFRTEVVNRMSSTASGDLKRRIGIVQSWGQPTFATYIDL
ncbi:MAG TPA: patatin-like phospholipase family protein [Thermoanaerobaculia bacterium]|nr:patatin-like phospholipase family protein [Thermoanaerobaculia bacterium]